MKIDSAGNVGIGTTPKAWATAGGTKALQISTRTALWEAYNGTYLSNNMYYDGSEKYIESDEAAQISLGGDGTIYFRNAVSGTADAALTWNERMRIDSLGNVRFTGTAPNSGDEITRLNFYNTTSSLNLARITAIRQAGGSNYGALSFSTTNAGTMSEKMRIQAGGNVGIGTTSPSGILTVAGSVTQNSNNPGIELSNSHNSQTVLLIKNTTTRGYELAVGGSNNSIGSGSFYIFDASASASRLTIDSSGNVGIGTNTPEEKLVVMGDIGFGAGGYNGGIYANNTGSASGVDSNWGLEVQRTSGVDDYNTRLKYYPSNGSTRKAGIWSARDDYFTIYSDGDFVPNVIIPSGNVGIGTTSPAEKLTIDGTVSGAYVRISNAASGDVSSGYMIYNGSNLDFNVYTNPTFGNTTLLTREALAIRAGGSERMRIDSSGNVGIGTTSPDNKLQVVAGNGNVQAWFGESSYTRSALRVGGDNSPGGRLFFEYNGDDSYIDSYGGHGSTQRYRDLTIAARNIIFKTGITSGSEKMRITSDGDLTVNDTNSNNCTLHINSYQKNAGNAARIGNMQICMEGNGSAYPNIGYGQRSTTNTTGYVYAQSDYASWFRFHAGGIQSYTAPGGTSGNAISFTTGPYVSQGGTTWTSGSDINLKENIKPLNKVLDKIKDYRCVEYSLKSDANKSKKIGFIAQDWEQDFAQVIEKDNEENLGIKYTETIPILLKAIQELKADNDSLKARIETLENN
jgi:hypothetical protein